MPSILKINKIEDNKIAYPIEAMKILRRDVRPTNLKTPIYIPDRIYTGMKHKTGIRKIKSVFS